MRPALSVTAHEKTPNPIQCVDAERDCHHREAGTESSTWPYRGAGDGYVSIATG